MKYRLKKDLPWFKTGEVIDVSDGIKNVSYKGVILGIETLKDKEWFEKVVEKKIDFSKFIIRSYRDLVIKGDNYLISWASLNISYYKEFNSSIEELNYIETELKDLEKGDVFILKDVADRGELNKSYFRIFIGFNNGNYLSQFLSNSSGIEIINWGCYNKNNKVYKFLRE